MILTNTLVHHVHFWLTDKADLPKLLEGLNLLQAITHIRDIHIGIAADTDADVVERTYDASLTILFDSRAALDAYDSDPIHQVFVHQYARQFCSKVVVTDAVNA